LATVAATTLPAAPRRIFQPASLRFKLPPVALGKTSR
jgi:hypothetical protein